MIAKICACPAAGIPASRLSARPLTRAGLWLRPIVWIRVREDDEAEEQVRDGPAPAPGPQRVDHAALPGSSRSPAESASRT